MSGTVKSAAVLKVDNTFYAGRGSGLNYQVAQTYIVFPILYFTIPGYYPNGHGATQTAIAVDRATDATSNWYQNNTYASVYQLGNQWKAELKKQMAILLQGTVSPTPTFEIKNPAPFVSNISTTGNCN